MFNVSLTTKETFLSGTDKWKDYIGVLYIDALRFDVSYSLRAGIIPKETQDKIITAVKHCLGVLKNQYNSVYPSNMYNLPSNERELITMLMMAMNSECLGFVKIRPYCAY